MRDDQVVIPRQRRERPHGSLDVRLLDFGVGLLASFQQGVAAERGDDSHGRWRVATVAAPAACFPPDASQSAHRRAGDALLIPGRAPDMTISPTSRLMGT